MKNLTIVAAGLASAICATTAGAQSRAEFVEAFSGDWFVFDDRFGNAGTCAVTLSSDTADDALQAKAEDCTSPLDTVATWDIVDGRIVLMGVSGSPLAALGGNQRRITGESEETGRGLILERAAGDGSSAALNEALQRHRCLYVGYTQDCADEATLTTPEFDSGIATVETLVTLNARSQPRRDASIIGTVPGGTEIKVNDCTTASDGVWCRARFGDENAWLAKTALRQGEWPVVTYINAGAVDAGDS